MATTNPFDLLGVDDAEDPTQLLAAQLKLEKVKQPAQVQAGKADAKSAKLPFKPLPPAQAVKEAKSEAFGGASRGGRGYGRGRGSGGGRFNRDVNNTDSGKENNGYTGGYRPSEERDAGKSFERRGGYGGPRRGGRSNGDTQEEERPRRFYDRHSGSGRGNQIKRDGSGQGNWGSATDDVVLETEESVIENNKNLATEKQAGDEVVANADKESPVNDPKGKDPADDEMTLEEYEKILEEKRKALLSLKAEERKVDSKVFESMKQLSSKKTNDEVFAKLGSDKEKRKDVTDKEEKAKKSVSINEFLKPADGERHYVPGGRGRGRGRGLRAPGGGYGGNYNHVNIATPSIEDQGQFPSLVAK